MFTFFNGRIRITNPFAPKNGHFGLDGVAEDDKTVYAVRDGKCINASDNDPDGWGINVAINPDDAKDMRDIYAHFEKALVKKGDYIKKGDKIGIMGHTGHTIPKGPGGTHTHFECRKLNGGRDTAINPLPILGLSEAYNVEGKVFVDDSKVKPASVTTEKVLVKQVQHTITATKTVNEDKLLAETTKLKTLGYGVSSKQTASAIYEIKTVKATSFAKGNAVTVKAGAKTYEGKKLADWVNDGKTKFHVLENPVGNRVVIGNAKGEVTAAVRKEDLVKA